MTRLSRTQVLLGCALVVVWVVGGTILVPWLVRSAYLEQSHPFLNDMLAGRSDHGLDHYLAAWTWIFRLLTAVLVMGGAFAIAVARSASLRARIMEVLRPSDSAHTARLPQALLIGAAFGLAAGTLEAAGVWARVLGRGLPWWQQYSAEVVWMAPVGYTLLFVALVLAAAAALRVFTSAGLPLGLFVFSLGTIASYSAFRSLRTGADPLALLILSLGIATALARAAVANAQRFRRHAIRTAIVCAAVASVGAGTLVFTGRVLAPHSTPPAGVANVLLIILDTVRAASLGLYGSAVPTTPNLDRFAESAVVFENAFATASWTLPSHASIFTGRLPHELGADWTAPLDGSHPTVAEAFSSTGYVTAGFAANEFFATRRSGLGRGFQFYRNPPVTPHLLVANTWLLRRLVERFTEREGPPQGLSGRMTADHINQRFLHWLDAQDDRPFFAFLNYMDAHSPYVAPPPFDTALVGRRVPLRWDPRERYTAAELRDRRIRYHQALRYLDDRMGGLLAELERRGMLQNTVVIVTSDHGEEFGERTVEDVGHGNNLHAPTLRVPLLISIPHSEPGGTRVATPVSLKDLAVTMLELAGVPNSALPGAPLLTGSAGSGEAIEEGPAVEWGAAVAAELNLPPDADDSSERSRMRSLVRCSYHYIVFADGTEELYDLGRDEWERRQLMGEERARLLPLFRTAAQATFGVADDSLSAADTLAADCDWLAARGCSDDEWVGVLRDTAEAVGGCTARRGL